MQDCGRRGELEGGFNIWHCLCVHLSLYNTALCTMQDVLLAGMRPGVYVVTCAVCGRLVIQHSPHEHFCGDSCPGPYCCQHALLPTGCGARASQHSCVGAGGD